MSQENVKIVRRMTQVWNARGWQGVVDEGLLHPDIEYHDDPDWPEARSAYGIEALVGRFDGAAKRSGSRATPLWSRPSRTALMSSSCFG